MSLLPEKVLDSKVSVFGYLCLCLNVLFFSALFVADPLTFQALTREDYWVENLTALWFLLAGLLLFVTALVERSFFRCCVDVTIALFRASTPESCGIVELSSANIIVAFEEKPVKPKSNLASAGILAFKPGVLRSILNPDDRDMARDVPPRCV